MKFERKYDTALKVWRTNIVPTTERVWDEESGTWSEQPIEEKPVEKVEKVEKKVAKKKKVSKKKR